MNATSAYLNLPLRSLAEVLAATPEINRTLALVAIETAAQAVREGEFTVARLMIDDALARLKEMTK